MRSAGPGGQPASAAVAARAGLHALVCKLATWLLISPLLSLPSVCVSPCHRYDHALNKANYASLALRPEAASTAAAVADEDDGAGEEEEDLYASLAK